MLPLLAILVSLSAQMPQLIPVLAISPDRVAVDSIKAGHHDCPHCDLAGADRLARDTFAGSVTT